MTELMWIEKYRPKTFESIKGQDKIVERIHAFVKQKNLPHLLFAGPAGIGKCVCPDTLILDGYGNLLTIEQAYKDKIKTVMSLDKEGKISAKKISYFYKGFSNKIYRIKTNFGTNIGVTPEHPFLALEEGKLKWIQSKDLKEGMHIASPELLKNREFKHILKIPDRFVKIKDYYSYYSPNGRYSCKIKIPKLDEEFYYWLGLIFGDGNFRNSSIKFYNSNNGLRGIFKALSYKIFGKNIKIIDVIPEDRCPYTEIRKATTIVRILEENLGYKLCRKKSGIIKVPKELYTSNLRNISSFIKGLYETDGSYYKSYMEISSMSNDLLIGLRYLLLMLGISSRIKKKKILLSGSMMIRKFDETIKPIIKNPTRLKKNNTNIDVLPINVDDIRFLLKIFGISYKEIGNNFSYIIEEGYCSRANALRFYYKLTEIIRDKIKFGIEAISILNSVKNFRIDPEKVFDLLKDCRIRKEIKVVDYDRLKEFYDRKREPYLRNYLRIIKRLYELKLRSKDEYDNIVNMITIRQKILDVLGVFNISYNEIARSIKVDAGTVKYILNEDGLSLMSMNRIGDIFTQLKSIIETKIFNERCMSILEGIDFLKNAEIIWDAVKSVDIDKKSFVYDLNVEDTHNFIGGNSPLILHNTSLILAAAKELYGDEWEQNIMETNASSDRGIDVVREAIKNFARTKAIGDVGWKICILDEADSLTSDAQNALRRTMEQYSSNCRFCLIANYSSKIIEPIQSRCTIFRFKPLEEKNIEEIVYHIAKNENLKINENVVKTLYEISEGDVRRVINILQSCAAISKDINENLIFEIVSAAKPKEVKAVLETAVKGNFIKARDLLLETMLKHGLSGLDIIKQIQKEIWNLDAEDEKKVQLIERCGEIEFRMSEGSDEFVQIEALLASFVLAGK